jgi:tetratricopeptide (TPR) repeat protein
VANTETTLEGASTAPTPINSKEWASLSRAGRNALRMRDLPTAEARYTDALAASMGFRHHDARAASSLGNLANVAALYQAERRYEDADRVIAVLIEAHDAGRGPSFDAFGVVLLDQAVYLESLRADLEAIGVYEVALELPYNARTDFAKTRLQVQHRLGKALLREGLHDRAEPHVNAVLDAMQVSPGPEAKATATAWLDVAKVREGQHQTASAEEAYRTATRILEKVDPGSIELAMSQNATAWFLLEQERNLESLPLAKNAAKILVDLNVGGGALASVLDTLALAEMRTRRLHSAEEHFKQAIDARDQADPETRRSLVSILENYAELLRDTNRPEEARKIEARIEEESSS